MRRSPALLAMFVAGWLVSPSRVRAEPGPYCAGDYAEDLSALSAKARSIESANIAYSYAVRTSAVYECVSYGSDGNLKRTRASAKAHGTAFGYRRDGGDTLLLTNHHVAEWPVVTDDEHTVDGVPAGCKKVSDSLKIVDDDHDDYAADDIPLARVVSDPVLDIAIVRAKQKLEIIPWKVGKSATLTARNVVEVKGFPLGEFRATNIGKVISAYDHDVQGERNHDDFVIDALLTSGGSGSPVFAISCKTGEFELVGVFHARYAGASALNVVIAIDQVRDEMATLKRSPPHSPDRPIELDAAARARLTAAALHDADPPFFSVGPLVASVRARNDGSLVFAIYPSDFPRTTSPLVAIEDDVDADPKAFGKLGTVYLAGASGLQRYVPAEADAEAQALIARLLTVLRSDALATFDYRNAVRTTADSRSAFERISGKKRALDRMLDAQRDTPQATLELTSHVASKPGVAVSLREIEADVAVPAAVTAPSVPTALAADHAMASDAK
ncbi:MAG TPA: serine protease [Kofleriaceae bacterium]|nr:serine protease [Kofleriaceae bacterium]